MIKNIQTPFTVADARSLKAGDEVRLTGYIWTGRDAAHKKLVALLESGAELPVDLKDQIIYFVGPCPAPPGRPIGSAGPTTSGRMDAYSPTLIAQCGLTGMIGKGGRSAAVVEAMKTHGAVYFGATGGAGALIAKKIKSCEVIAFPELGTEAVHKLYVEDFPLVVAIDAEGNSLYD